MKTSALLLALLLATLAIVSVSGQEIATEVTLDDLEISEEERVDPVDPSASGEAKTLEEQDESTLDPSVEEQDESKNQTQSQDQQQSAPAVHQRGPFIDLLGESLLSLEMVDESTAQLVPHYTNEALNNKKVVGLYFSADWCGPCRQFTPELVNFYNKMNARRGKKEQFEIVWVSRCRDVKSFGQYFTQMNWLALPPEEALGERGQWLGQKYKVKSIPTLVLLDEVGNVITTDARNKIPQDKAGIGFPWRNPLATLYMTVLPKSLRLMVRSQLTNAKKSVVGRIKGLVGIRSPAAAAA